MFRSFFVTAPILLSIAILAPVSASDNAIDPLLRTVDLDFVQETPAAERPNVLWLISDDHAAYVTGCYGNATVRTPHLDRLAGEGMRFDRAYCNSPVCTASRASFITGMYPRTLGVTLLSTPLPAAAITLGEVLKDAGYDTAWYGKTHFNSGLKHGFEVLQGNGDWRRWLRQQDQEVDATSPHVLPPWKPFRNPARLWINGVYLPFGLPDNLMWDTWFARQGADFITNAHDQPWCCVVSLTTPHSPFRFPLEFRDRHDPTQFAAPQIGPEDDWQIPGVFRDLTDAEKQKVQASYYTSTEFTDKKHLKQTSRLPDQVPATDNPMAILDYCSQPHDLSREEALSE